VPKEPRLVDEVREIDLAAAGPSAAHSGRHDQAIIEQNFHIQIIDWEIVEKQCREVSKNEIASPIAQGRHLQSQIIRWVHVYNDARVFPEERFKDWGKDRRDGFGATDPEFPSGRIGQKLDVPYSLLQFVKGCEAPLEKRMAVHSWLDAMRIAVEKSHAERAFEIGNHVRYGWLGDA